jgi:hypothetical protein
MGSWYYKGFHISSLWETMGDCVSHLFVHNLTLRLHRLKVQKKLLSRARAPNVLTYHRFRYGAPPSNGELSDVPSPTFIARQYMFANLKDRLSTQVGYIDG